MTVAIDRERVAALDTIDLKRGEHASPEDGLCVMEAAAWVAREPHSDHPDCVSPVLGAFLRRWNDDLDDEDRQKLKPFVLRVVGTAGDGQDEARGWLALDWLVRAHAPAWLGLAGFADEAGALRALPPLHDEDSLNAACPLLAAAWTTARDAAGAAARDAARDAGGTAAWDALKPTMAELQASALGLLDRMIDPKEAAA